MNVAGQTWTLTFSPSPRFLPSQGRALAIFFAAISTALALATAMTLRAQARASAGAEALATASQRSLSEKDLLLQEMTHRIKNAIARILAIARQTAARADSLSSFTDSFTRRLQAMAEAQDMLSRSATAKADLSDLLSRELAQVFGADFDPARLRGPKVQLDADRTQALGLVFHELATNALEVRWRSGRTAGDLRWLEPARRAGRADARPLLARTRRPDRAPRACGLRHQADRRQRAARAWRQGRAGLDAGGAEPAHGRAAPPK